MNEVEGSGDLEQVAGREAQDEGSMPFSGTDQTSPLKVEVTDDAKAGCRSSQNMGGKRTGCYPRIPADPSRPPVVLEAPPKDMSATTRLSQENRYPHLLMGKRTVASQRIPDA